MKACSRPLNTQVSSCQPSLIELIAGDKVITLVTFFSQYHMKMKLCPGTRRD